MLNQFWLRVRGKQSIRICLRLLDRSLRVAVHLPGKFVPGCLPPGHQRLHNLVLASHSCFRPQEILLCLRQVCRPVNCRQNHGRNGDASRTRIPVPQRQRHGVLINRPLRVQPLELAQITTVLFDNFLGHFHREINPLKPQIRANKIEHQETFLSVNPTLAARPTPSGSVRYQSRTNRPRPPWTKTPAADSPPGGKQLLFSRDHTLGQPQPPHAGTRTHHPGQLLKKPGEFRWATARDLPKHTGRSNHLGNYYQKQAKNP